MKFLKKSPRMPYVSLMIGAIICSWVTCDTLALAKIRPLPTTQVQPIKASSIKEVIGQANLTLQQGLSLPENGSSIPFQDGKNVTDIDFFRSPRCYLHIRTAALQNKKLYPGYVLEVSKIDNIYANGAVHVTFYFDHDSSISKLTCITNYQHTLTTKELKNTLGTFFKLALTKTVENEAFFDTVPTKSAPVLTDPLTNPTTLGSIPADNHSIHAARILLTDS